ncbi:type II toxin-antitoxin system RelE/ParE family toxin [Candidatus Woesearchaeota archaeon]|jgi:mRNA interferase RelE/StbE|nr:type II toxin-antitoxin system RelE/ParE family toxin [Candidatus Woesearchaeota archaeon]MBT7237505.1 type II toxin-antitoxin system RelE/ParE family toxin [Candidatus Woesearchaeota archaeon]
MSYSLGYSKLAEAQIKKLDKSLQKRIISKLGRIRVRPFSYVKKLIGVPEYSLRVGDYRIILDIVKGKLIILVLEVGHRKNIYKK